MATFTSYPTEQIAGFQDKIKTALTSCSLYEQAAQKFSEAIYAEFSPNVVLARVFITIPFGQLPNFNKSFVNNLANAKGVANLINDKTPILTLVGTVGKKPAWMDRRQSQGHVGIPLCSASFIDAIPMMSRLIQEIGLDLAWFDKQDLSIVEKSPMGMTGLFCVADASRGVDAKGRKIIAAQDFVAANGVRTVFGMGTTYMSGAFAVCIIFTSETITKEQLKPQMTLISVLKSCTVKLVSSNAWLAA